MGYCFVSIGSTMLGYSIVDAFTRTPFKGNPAAVVMMDPGSPPPSDTTLQLIATEFNVSNTAFVTPVNSDIGLFNLRWFTPSVEVALCGHATLASASILFSHPDLLPGELEVINFQTRRSGVLTAMRLPDGRIELNLPASEVTAVEGADNKAVEGVVRRAFQLSISPTVRFIGTGKGVPFNNFVLVEVDDVDLEGTPIKPESFSDLPLPFTACVLTHKSHKPSETFVSRVFGPMMGIPEDPVTGSMHCMLGPYWSRKLQVQEGGEMIGRQASFRSGDVGVVWEREKMTCKIRGHAVLVASGEIRMRT